MILNLPLNTLEHSLKHHWSHFETPLKHPWNIIEILEIPFKLSWNTIKTLDLQKLICYRRTHGQNQWLCHFLSCSSQLEKKLTFFPDILKYLKIDKVFSQLYPWKWQIQGKQSTQLPSRQKILQKCWFRLSILDLCHRNFSLQNWSRFDFSKFMKSYILAI